MDLIHIFNPGLFQLDLFRIVKSEHNNHHDRNQLSISNLHFPVVAEKVENETDYFILMDIENKNYTFLNCYVLQLQGPY